MATKAQHEWLREQLKGWVREGLITTEQEVAIGARYPIAAATSWGTVIFSSIGAVIAGLGVILLFAYNWAAIPKFGKLALILGTLAATHAVGLALFVRHPRTRALGDGVCLLGSMLFGAGIWLVAQIYHIDEHFPSGFVIWGGGALLMALAMPSIPQAILAAVLLVVWGGTERLGFDTPVILAPLILVTLLAPLAYAQRSRLLAAIVIPAFVLTFAFAQPPSAHHPWLLLSTLLSLGALLIAKAFLVRRHGHFPGAAPVVAFYGWTITLGTMVLMSFPRLTHEFFAWERSDLSGPLLAYWILPLVACLAAWAGVAYERQSGKAEKQPGDLGFALFLIPLTVVLALCDQIYLHHLGGWAVAGPFNLVLVGLAGTMMAAGCRDGRLAPTLVGSILLVAVVIARYFDLFENLFIRGLLFFVMGAVIFAEGALYTRNRKAGGRTP